MSLYCDRCNRVIKDRFDGRCGYGTYEHTKYPVEMDGIRFRMTTICGSSQNFGLAVYWAKVLKEMQELDK